MDNIEAAHKKGKKSAKKPRISKPAPDFTPQLGKLTLRFDQEPSGSNVPTPKVKRSLRTQRTKPYTPIVDANIRKDNILQTRDELKKTGKQCPVNFRWYHNRFRDATSSYELEFAVAHFVDPASIVPLALLPVHAGNPPPTIQECAKDEELYPNEFIRGAIAGNHPAIAFQAIYLVRTVLKVHLAYSDIPAYPSLDIFTGLDYDSAASAAYPPWQDSHRMWQEQTKAFEHFVRMALDFLKAKIRRPLCLLLRNKKNSIHKAIPDALDILRLMQVPNNFPFFLTNWSGSPDDAWRWLREYPNTIFGITFDFVTTKTDRENVQFLRELPLSNMVLESGSPKIRCDGQYSTLATCLETAILIAQKSQENHRYILEQTAWTALKPQPTRPAFALIPPAKSSSSLICWLDHTNKSILDQVPEGESANVFEALIMDFSPNVESFQEMDVRRERASSGQGHMAAPSIDDATDESKRESSDSKGEQRASPAPLDYEAEEAAAAAYEADVLDKAKYLAARVTFPGGKTLAEKKAEPAIVKAAAETFAERKARGQRIKAAIEESKKTKPCGFSRRDDSAVLDYPEFDDSYWDIENCPRPFELAEPVNPSRWSIMLPNPKTTYFEPLQDCRDHDVDNDPHLRIEDAIPSYRIICKEKGGRRPAEASAIGRLHISSYGKMYLILWASRHHMKPRQANEPQRANPVVLEFINAVARHRSSELPQLLDEYFDRIRDGFTDEPISPYDFKTVIMRWYDSCPNAAAFYDDHATGPIYYSPPFLQGCRRDIADAYTAVAQPYFRETMDWTRMRHYQVKMGFQRQWTHSRDIANTHKNNIVRVKVNTENILQQEQVMFVDDWGEQFAHNLRPDVQVVRLSNLHSEAIKESREYFMGRLVRKVYWFHGASAFQLRTEGYARTITNVSQHFTRMFPHVRFYHILAPFTRQEGRAWHDQLHAFVERIASGTPG